jgi:4-diphosphocytidyl-2C-methyl-D-erythritol kinase
MSGSGSCYFGLCRHGRHARRVARCLEAHGVGIAFAVRSSF